MGCCYYSTLKEEIRVSENFIKEYENLFSTRRISIILIRNEFYKNDLHLNPDKIKFENFCKALNLQSKSNDYKQMKNFTLSHKRNSNHFKIILFSLLFSRDPKLDKIKVVFDLYAVSTPKKIFRDDVLNMVMLIHEISCKDITVAVSKLKETYESQMILDYSKELNQNKVLLADFLVNFISNGREFLFFEEFYNKMISQELNIFFEASLMRKFCLRFAKILNDNPETSGFIKN